VRTTAHAQEQIQPQSARESVTLTASPSGSHGNAQREPPGFGLAQSFAFLFSGAALRVAPFAQHSVTPTSSASTGTIANPDKSGLACHSTTTTAADAHVLRPTLPRTQTTFCAVRASQLLHSVRLPLQLRCATSAGVTTSPGNVLCRHWSDIEPWQKMRQKKQAQRRDAPEEEARKKKRGAEQTGKMQCKEEKTGEEPTPHEERARAGTPTSRGSLHSKASF
jgi:hypothetical protein